MFFGEGNYFILLLYYLNIQIHFICFTPNPNLLYEDHAEAVLYQI